MKPKHPLLKEYFYPEKEIGKLIRLFKKGEFKEKDNIVKGDITIPADETFPPLPDKNSSRYRELYSIGRQAIEKGQLAAAVLNGGMATRFGGVVKGIVEVFNSKSFLQLKVTGAAAVSENIKIYIMNSFSTDTKTLQHFEENNYFDLKEKIRFLNQFIAPRLTPSGDFYKNAESKESFYGPGHGDFPYAFSKSGCLDEFISEGGKYIFLSNVDNLGAKVEPAILGMHIASKKELSAEVAHKDPDDEGGAPLIVNGRLQLVEALSFPEDFDQSRVPVFNCNSYWINAESLKKKVELPWYLVKKKINDETVVQFEHICGDLTKLLDSGFIKVSRKDRFLPVKRPEDLHKNIDRLKEATAFQE